MPETMPTRDTAPTSPKGLVARVELARWALLWERFWPECAIALAVLGIFLVAALFDLPSLVPGWLHAAGLTILAALLAVALWQAFRALRVPDATAARRRIEAASGLTHRPLAAIADRLVGGADDPVATALWDAHRRRMAEQARRLR